MHTWSSTRRGEQHNVQHACAKPAYQGMWLGQLVSWSANQAISHIASPTVNRSVGQSVSQSVDRLISQSVSWSVNQSIS